MKKLSELEQFKILDKILSTAKEKANFNDNGKIKVELRIKTNSDNDTEIFIQNGFKIYAFRCFAGNEFTFFERWNNFPNKVFSQTGLITTLITLIK